MRLALGFVLSWFGVQELHNPAEWAVFVPAFISDHSPVAVNDLILLHGFLLVLAAAAIVLGLLYLLSCLLAVGLLSEIVLGLWLNGGVSDLVIRDLGLLALAAALTIDPVRFWHLERALPQRLLPSHRRPKPGKTHEAPPLPRQASWPVRASGGALLVVAVLGLAFLVRATGSSGVPLPRGSAAVVPTDQARPSPTPGGGASSATPATPTPSGTPAAAVRFADWRYRQYAFEIYPGAPSPEAKKALAGFDLTVQDQDNKVLLVLKALSARYRDASVLVDKGNTAYFIETSMRDDAGNEENDLGDDGVVVVDAQGYIVQS